MIEKFNFALLGRNIQYSKSPAIFESIFDYLKIEGNTFLYDLDDLTQLKSKIDQDKINGLSVTIPYKKELISLLDDVGLNANTIQAVNSIALEEGQLVGYNTDCDGFSYPLLDYRDQLDEGKAVIFGSGGSAKAVIYALHHDFNICEFVIVGRDENKLEDFQIEIKEFTDDSIIKTTTYNEYKHTEYDIVVNCSPMGGFNDADTLPFPDDFEFIKEKIYYDLNYNTTNRAIEKAKDHGLMPLDGSRMLVAQAVRSFYLWTSIEVPFDDIYHSIFKN